MLKLSITPSRLVHIDEIDGETRNPFVFVADYDNAIRKERLYHWLRRNKVRDLRLSPVAASDEAIVREACRGTQSA